MVLVNHANQDDVTALVFAIINAKLAVIKFLLEHGANINL